MATAHLSYRNLLAVLAALLFLTALTIILSWFDFGAFKIWLALLIACSKGALIAMFFMHLKYESPLIKWSFLGVVLIILVLGGLTFLDTALREVGHV